MKILIANLGSTSFKYRLLDMTDESQLARGSVDRIGSDMSHCVVQIADQHHEMDVHVADHAEAVRSCLKQLTDPTVGCLKSEDEVAAIGFKAVHGGRKSGVQRVDEEVLQAMSEMNQVAPAHNPPYIDAMRLLHEKFPEIPLVAAFETGFHQTIPNRRREFAISRQWTDEFQIKRWGFHGASHRYIATRVAELIGPDLRVISCHLGGSSSLCAIRGEESVATTMGMSPQSGLPQNNRVGNFDPFALPLLMEKTGKSLDELLDDLAEKSGLLGVSRISSDIRDIEKAAQQGDEHAILTLDLYTTAVRDYLGSYMVELGGLDVLVFTGGIGENGAQIRQAICQNMETFGMVLDEHANAEVSGEKKISHDSSQTQIWVLPTNEEIIVARQVKQLLE